MAYKHFKHAWPSESGTFLFWREGWEIESPSECYTTWANWNLIETLETIEQIPEPYRTKVRRREVCIYQSAALDEPATRAWRSVPVQMGHMRDMLEKWVDAVINIRIIDMAFLSALRLRLKRL